jgi:pyridoxal 5'-phosphate synthase pdxT subunit
LKIGVLALQGDFLEHQQVLDRISVESCQVRNKEELDGLNGLIIPGGESTVIGKLAEDFGLLEPLRTYSKEHAVWGTCAGSIFLSRDVRRDQPLLGLMDITIERNAYGRQVDSFEIDVDIPALKTPSGENPPFHAIFIRAPLIEKIGSGVDVLSTLPDGRIVAARQGHWLATAFHPELTRDDRLHRYFLEMVLS